MARTRVDTAIFVENPEVRSVYVYDLSSDAVLVEVLERVTGFQASAPSRPAGRPAPQ